MNDRALELAPALTDETRTRRAMLHILEDLQRERNAIQRAHEEWIKTVDAVRDPMMVHDAEGRIVRANRAYAERAQLSFEDLLGRHYWECFPKGDGPLPGCSLAELFTNPPSSEQEFSLPGGEVFVSRVFIVARGAERPHALNLFENVTDKKAADRRIRSLNTLYATLSAVNHAIVHSRSPREVFERIVGIATGVGPWHAAWIGLVSEDGHRVVPQAWSASLNTRIEALLQAINASRCAGDGPTALTLANGVPYFSNDVDADATTLPWRDTARQFDVAAIAVLPLRVGGAVCGVLSLYARHRDIFTAEVRALVVEMADDISYSLDMLETERRRSIAERALIENEAKLRRSLVATIEAIAATLEARDAYTAGHQRRVADLARAIADEMGIDKMALEGIHFGALIHDIGKIQVPAEILSKPTRLSRVEFELVKTHPEAGYDIVKGIDFPWPVAAMVHQHHERYDGSGYPRGLKGEQIALEARILAVADVVEAMASHRPYRAGLGMEAALKEIADKRGIWFDPAVADACLRLFREKRFAFA